MQVWWKEPIVIFNSDKSYKAIRHRIDELNKHRISLRDKISRMRKLHRIEEAERKILELEDLIRRLKNE